ncbi:MAG: ACP S-malonyltransferase [Candidatus Omnitrophota bacterium]
MKAVIFPGQGAQYVGMGKDLYDNFPEAKDLFNRIDDIVKFELSDKCFSGPAEELRKTSIQQLAILSVSLAAYEVFKKKRIEVNFFSGLSLGEYSCLYPAGILSLEDLVFLVKERALAMAAAAQNNSSCMFAVLGLDQDIVEKKQNIGFSVANVNAPGQVAISLSFDKKEVVKEELAKEGAKVVELDVSGGFHSHFMEPAKRRLEGIVKQLNFHDAKVPLVSNFTAESSIDKEVIRNNLVDQLTHTVLWKKSVELMVSRGVDIFYEIGPSRVLKGIMRKINPQLKVINMGEKDDFDSTV